MWEDNVGSNRTLFSKMIENFLNGDFFHIILMIKSSGQRKTRLILRWLRNGQLTRVSTDMICGRSVGPPGLSLGQPLWGWGGAGD